jgi:hypothetical protein
MSNISIGGQQYNCKYLNKCIKPCRINHNIKKQINPALVRSCEAQEKQELYSKINNLERRTNNLENKLEILLKEMLPEILNNRKCLQPSNRKLLQKSKAAMDYMNMCSRVSVLFKRVDQMAEVTDTVMEINDIKVNFRFQPGVKRYNLCRNINILTQRLDYMKEIIEYFESIDDHTNSSNTTNKWK